jgi:DNA-binding NarL/FixJ family response regulator
VLRALRAGAVGFLVKSTPPEDLIGLVRVAAEGHTVLSPAAARRLVAASAESFQARDQLVASLTEREAEVLACLGQGLSNAQIASRLYLSEATVKGYVSRTLDKLDCQNRTQAGLIAHDACIARPLTRLRSLHAHAPPQPPAALPAAALPAPQPSPAPPRAAPSPATGGRVMLAWY